MNVNATLIIQACNFFIASFIMRRFLFKPVLAIINKESAKKQALLTIIDQQMQSLEILQNEQQVFLHECKQYFTDHWPVIEDQHLFILKKITPDIISKKISSTEIEQLTAHVLKNLEEKIKHVH